MGIQPVSGLGQYSRLSCPLVSPEHLIETFGTVGLFAIVFAESGLLVGFFLPGDSLLFTAGVLASQGNLNLPVVLAGCFLAAVAGDQVGYGFGTRIGPALFQRPNSRFFHQDHLRRAEKFFDRHGARAIVLARFMPIIRTFTPVLAGVSSMKYRTFVTFNVIGGFAWAVGVTSAGFVLGETVPGVDRYLLPIIAVIVALSILPGVFELLRHRRRSITPPEPELLGIQTLLGAMPEQISKVGVDPTEDSD